MPLFSRQVPPGMTRLEKSLADVGKFAMRLGLGGIAMTFVFWMVAFWVLAFTAHFHGAVQWTLATDGVLLAISLVGKGLTAAVEGGLLHSWALLREFRGLIRQEARLNELLHELDQLMAKREAVYEVLETASGSTERVDELRSIIATLSDETRRQIELLRESAQRLHGESFRV